MRVSQSRRRYRGKLLLFLLSIFLTWMSGTDAFPARASAARSVLVEGVDVLTMTDAGMLRNRDVLITGDRIVRVSPSGEVAAGNVRRVNGRGLVMTPGLTDMHVHFAPVPGAKGDPAHRAAAVMLAHGITTARSMAGASEHLALRDAIERGDIPGPRLYLASPGLSDANTANVDAGRASVRAAKEKGFDLVKSHHLTDPEIWRAIREEAEQLEVATAGHVSNSVGLMRAARAGQQIEHLDGFAAALLPQGAAERTQEFGQLPPPAVLSKVDPSSAQALTVFDELARLQSYQVPTLGLFEKLTALDLPLAALRARPEMRFVPAAALDQWAAQRAQLAGVLTPEQTGRLRMLRREIVRKLHKAGVPLMTGSDTAQAFHVWGPALHEELAILAEIIGPEPALAAATTVPASYFRSLPNQGSARGWKANFGTVEEGARADLLLVKGNPLDDLGSLKRPEVVFAGGRFYDRRALDRMLKEAAMAANPPEAGAAPVFLMRHLPSEEQEADPALTAPGRAAAQRLSERLAEMEIGAIFVTDTRRARQTAEPLAERFGLTPIPYDPRDPAGLAKEVRDAGVPALVIGHSNTIPDLAVRFGAAPEPAAETAQFGKVLTLAGEKTFMTDLANTLWPSPCSKGLPPGARCGRLFVPEDRTKPDGRAIGIRYAVLPAREAATDDPLVVIPGGPGLGAVQTAAGIAQLYAPFRANRDLLLIDQRGTGGSNRLACDAGTNGGLLEALRPRKPGEAKACRDRLAHRADPAAYGTRAAVLDMEALRAALGYERLDLFGMSYGTRPVLDYLRLFPERTGEIVIRAAAPTDMTLPLWTPRDAQLSFETLVRMCKTQPDCARRHPDLDGELRKLLARVDAAPVPVSVVDPRTGEQVETELSAEALRQILFFLLYIPEFAVQLPPLLEQAAAGEVSPMVQAAAPALVGLVGEVAWGLRWSVICDEDVRRIDKAQVAEAVAGTFLGRTSVDQDVDACRFWPAGIVPAGYFAPVASDAEVLIISGALDPVAGERWGDRIAETLPNAVHVVAADASHLPPMPGCSGELIRAFLDGAELASLDTACVERGSPLRLNVAEGGDR